jgi:hypothetical protein
MNEILYIIIIAFLVIVCIRYKILSELEEKRNNELQEQLEVLHVLYNALKVKLKRRKELLEMQDKLLKESK